MFEKEAGNDKIKENHQFVRCARKSYKDGFKDGAEFGYNKRDEQLTKAKEIIKRLMHELVVSNRPYNEVELLVKDVEQFLKECE